MGGTAIGGKCYDVDFGLEDMGWVARNASKGPGQVFEQGNERVEDERYRGCAELYDALACNDGNIIMFKL